MDKSDNAPVQITIGTGLLLSAAAVLILDMARIMLGNGGMVALGDFWFALHSSSLNVAQAVIQRYISTFLWDPVVTAILHMPLWTTLCSAGLLFLGLGRPGAN